jgi:hypothetical protein
MTAEILPWLTFLAGSAFTYFMFWLEGRRTQSQQKKAQTSDLVKKVYSPLLAEIDVNLDSAKNVENLIIYRPPGEHVRWEELGFSTSEWDYVKRSGFYHLIEKNLAQKLHVFYGCLHEIRVWGGDVEGVLKGVKETKIEAKLTVLSKEIKEKIEELEKSIES